MINSILLVVLGMLIGFFWRFVLDRGHAVFGVQNQEVQQIMRRTIQRYTTLRYLHPIDSGPTHQQVFQGGTVIAYFDESPETNDLPKNARSYVVWGKARRLQAARDLAKELTDHGFEASIHEPLKNFPPGTFFMVTSNAFIHHAPAFRPHWLKMAYLEMKAGKN